MSDKLYQIKMTPTQVLLRVSPPGEARKKANLTEIQKELNAKKVDFRHDNLFEIYRQSSGKFEVIAARESEEFEATVSVSKGGLEATITITPPARGEAKLEHYVLKRALKGAKVQMGLLQDKMKELLEKEIYNEPVVIAVGQPPVHGTDGWIDFLQDETEAEKAAEPDIDTVIDYKELNLIKTVDDGDLIAQIHLPTLGEEGYNIGGRVLKARDGKPARISIGKNIIRSQDGLELHAGCHGFVVFSENKLSIEDVYQVSQVDSSTGNIHFTGVVRVIHGVDDNFTIEAEKGIDVGGVVGKATLISQGDIHVRGGVMGAQLTAEKNVSAKFINESEVVAGENITVNDYILHSNVQAGRSIEITKPGTGFINGGVTRCGDIVRVANLGTDVAEEKTEIQVGMRPNLRASFDKLQSRIDQEQITFDKLSKNLAVVQQQWENDGKLPESKRETFDQNLQSASDLRESLLRNINRYRELALEMAQQSEESDAGAGAGAVFVDNAINPGVSVQIQKQRIIVKTALLGGAFKLVRGEVKMQDYVEAMKIYRMQIAKAKRK